MDLGQPVLIHATCKLFTGSLMYSFSKGWVDHHIDATKFKECPQSVGCVNPPWPRLGGVGSAAHSRAHT